MCVDLSIFYPDQKHKLHCDSSIKGLNSLIRFKMLGGGCTASTTMKSKVGHKFYSFFYLANNSTTTYEPISENLRFGGVRPLRRTEYQAGNPGELTAEDSETGVEHLPQYPAQCLGVPAER